MFSQFRSQSFGRRKTFGRPHKESNSKKYHMRDWMRSNKNKQTAGSNKQPPIGFAGVIMSGDSAPPLQSSIPSPGYDLPDEVQPGKIISRESSLDESEKTNGNANSSPVTDDNIEQVSSDTTKTLSMLEENNKIESNGIDHTDNGKLVDEPDDDTCLIQCIYVTQQCCECTII